MPHRCDNHLDQWSLLATSRTANVIGLRVGIWEIEQMVKDEGG